ncbi:prepilin-type N-terminal cleavage/methylation domain-containing protein [Glaciecola sp. MH2013]|uniref:prepilin-type N-terminal cleavage/methylation domain-containing protein n=1 Tax=Glaciecola sp. MH2013 TaxID=2785524 RepID=UPI00189D9560|nr:prepilin-type N-terminal cleavage/methylation domain-containing protein [Glaciecola sp. MH2013]MBF7073700.1 prepilin-type N-terminal cleavage/methylation domain-containing protein [Glaciecola sp. MH2013]
MRNKAGFTLIELVMVIVVLGVVSVGITRFISSSTQIFVDTSERERLLRDGSFAVERINREIAQAIPNSVRLAGNAAVHCLQFVPMKWSTFYFDLPTLPDTDTEVDVVEMQDIDGTVFTPSINNDFAFVYPTSNADIYSNSSTQRRLISACSDDGDGDCSTDDDVDGVVQLSVNASFGQSSPAERLYIGQATTSYCVRGASIYRHESALAATQPVFSTGGVLMAENLANQLSANPSAAGTNSLNPFRIVDASLRRNAYTQTQFIFTRNNESMTFTQEIHIPNVP